MRKRIPAMVLGDLEGAERDLLVEHLKGCEGCRAERAHLEATLATAKRLPAPEPSAARRDRVVAAMAAAAGDSAPERPRRRLGSLGFAAAIALAVLGTWTVSTGRLGLAKPAFELTVEDVQGYAVMLPSGGTAWEPLAPGAVVRVGDRVLTNGGRAWMRSNANDLFALADGSQLRINQQDKDNPNVQLVYGELWAEVTPRDRGHLRIESPQGEGFVEVLGTRLHVEYR
jgi:ferric-dicitrate binding protein FerR (iron transport regulator)